MNFKVGDIVKVNIEKFEGKETVPSVIKSIRGLLTTNKFVVTEIFESANEVRLQELKPIVDEGYVWYADLDLISLTKDFTSSYPLPSDANDRQLEVMKKLNNPNIDMKQSQRLVLRALRNLSEELCLNPVDAKTAFNAIATKFEYDEII